MLTSDFGSKRHVVPLRMEDRLNTNTTAYGVFESLAVYGFFDYDEDDDSKLPGPSVTERRACTCFKF